MPSVKRSIVCKAHQCNLDGRLAQPQVQQLKNNLKITHKNSAAPQKATAIFTQKMTAH
jgi:hypothetical protein